VNLTSIFIERRQIDCYYRLSIDRPDQSFKIPITFFKISIARLQIVYRETTQDDQIGWA